MRLRSWSLLLAVALLVPAAAIGDAPAGAQAPDTVWLCRPGLVENPCESSRELTTDGGDGSRSVRISVGTARPPKIDCFYVYPTVSDQPGANADLTIDPQISGVAELQASRFSAACRVFAPMYPQITSTALRDGRVGDPAVQAKAYLGVADAWHDYLEHDNDGRGVVLIGHSQGAALLTTLLRREIDADPAVRRRVVSALLIGTNITVKTGTDVGGSFEHVPACRARDQVGCVVSYATFSTPPPPDSMFGRVGQGLTSATGPADSTLEVLCVNPAAPGGGSAPLHPIFPAPSGSGITTPWVSYPHLYDGECEHADGATWLQIDDVAAPDDPRPRVEANIGPRWGLHLVDVNLALGDLVSLVRDQARAYGRG